MRVLLRDQIDIGTPEKPTYFNEKELGFFEQIVVSLRIFIVSRKSAQRKREQQEAKENQKHAERVENLKTVILDQINNSLSPEVNKRLARANKKAFSVTLAIDRSFEDIIDEVLIQQEFDGFIIKRYKENEDVLTSCIDLPMCIEFERRLV